MSNPLPWVNLDSSLHPKHYLFMSIDAIGSTLLKTALQDSADKSSTTPSPLPWVKVLLDFLPETQVLYAQQFSKRVDGCPKKNAAPPCSRPCTTPTVWKFIGDEVVLSAKLDCKEQVYFYIHSLLDVLHTLNQTFAPKEKSTEENASPYLEFKATAWVAGFPVTNVEVNLPLGGNGSPCITDCIGPSIDLGFRLAKFATKSRLVISASLATFVNSLVGEKCNTEYLPIYTGGFVELKGVRGGKHPLFWLITKDADPLERDLLPPVTPDKLNTFLQKFFQPDNLPFLLAEQSVTPEYLTMYRTAVSDLQQINYTLFGQNKSVPQTSPAETSAATSELENGLDKAAIAARAGE